MLGHHFFCAALDGRVVNTDNIYGIVISQQAVFSAAGNAIASTAAFAFGSVVGVAIEQIMWHSFRHKPHTISEIDAVLECRTSPFMPSSWSAWVTTRRLTALAVLSAGMTLITVFAPGALGTTTVDFKLAQDCTIATVDMSKGTFGVEWPNTGTTGTTWYPSPQLRQLVSRNTVSSAYVPPASPCGVCSYDLVLNAPAMQCQNITDGYNFTGMVTGWASNELIIWNSTHNLPIGNNLTVATAEGQNYNLRAAACSFYNATYDLHVTHNGSLSTVDINHVSMHQPVSELDSSDGAAVAIRSIATATAQHLFGIGDIDVNKMISLILGNAPLLSNTVVSQDALGDPGPAQSKTWLWRGEMVNVLPQLMANISISMLSNPMDAQQKTVNTQCSYSGIVYAYKASQLILTYGVGTLVTFLCGLAGFWGVWMNGVEESGSFSRILASVLNDDMYRARPIYKDTRVKAENTHDAHLIPLS